ncbi:PHD-finger [Trichostrongylus colubriformis]|uniref:PHD-finger n=1 Tax=Trichostrongylus colubriformis TaxID=6319 RepID=A0AAN8FUW2_TRICO
MQPPSSDNPVVFEDSNFSMESMDSVENSIQDPPSVAAPPGPEPESDSVIAETPESSLFEGTMSAATIPHVPSTPKSLARVISADVTHRQIEVKDLIEYEWPFKSGDKYFLQEQVGDLLDIKSFSRKFPEMSRRKVEKVERDWLCATYNIHQTMNETQLRDLCAIRSVEIHDLMASEYPAIHQEFQKVTAERLKALMAEQAKEMEAIKNDSKKMAELREKAIKSAADFNRELQQAKKHERQHYWDVQTSIIQSATNKWKKVPPKYTKVEPYPVALIHGQFQNYYRKFTSQELRRLPLGSVLDGEHLFPVHRDPSPPPINVTERDMQRFERIAAAHQQNNAASPSPGVKAEAVTPSRVEVARKSSGSTVSSKSSTPRASVKANPLIQPVKCTMCEVAMAPGETFIKCGSCPLQSHPSCLDMNDEMAAHVATYPWQCIECKRCIVCAMGDREESMIFCDKCDRGFHTYCIGLSEAPQGTWICQQFCNPTGNQISTPKRPAGRKSSVTVN